MKIAIFGSYNGTSIGDTAILLGLLNGIAQVAPHAEVTVLTMGPIDLSRDLTLTKLARTPHILRANVFAPAEWPLVRSLWWRLERHGLPLGITLNTRRVHKLLRGQDLLVIGGGNLLMDLFEDSVGIIEDLVSAAKRAETPYVFAGVGAGPLLHAESCQRLRACLADARAVMVRDIPSQKICIEALGRADTQCAPDLAFALNSHATCASRKTLTVNIAAIGSPTWPVQDANLYRTYLEGMAQLTLAAAAQIHPDHIEIVTSNPAVDLEAARDLIATLKGQTALPINLLPLSDVTDVLKAFGRAQMAIVTRLHAGILAAHAGARVLAVAYQPKVTAVLAEQGIVRTSVPLDALCQSDFDPKPYIDDVRQHPAGVPFQARSLALTAIRALINPVVSVSA